MGGVQGFMCGGFCRVCEGGRLTVKLGIENLHGLGSSRFGTFGLCGEGDIEACMITATVPL